jgi:DNA-binding Xre family transcriptional regulator
MELVPVSCHIPDLLHKIGKNQVWLAKEVGIRPQRVTDIVKLRHPGITFVLCLKIAGALGCSVYDLFTWGWRQRK